MSSALTKPARVFWNETERQWDRVGRTVHKADKYLRHHPMASPIPAYHWTQAAVHKLKPEPLRMPPVPSPIAMPQQGQGDDAGDSAARQARKRRGFASTLIVGSLTPPSTGKKTLLGG